MKRRRNSAERARLVLWVSVLCVICCSVRQSHAYAGPGAGFAVLSSFWTLFVAFLYSIYAFIVLAVSALFRLLRHRKAYGNAQIKRAVILGFDGMDPELTDRFMAEGRLPNLAKLREQGTFRKLRTTYPGDFSGGVVDLHDGSESRQAQYLRFPCARSQQLSSVSFFG